MSARDDARTGRQPGEFELIARLAEIVGSEAPGEDLLVGIGDDAAVVRRGSLADIYTTDTVVDGVHFHAGQISWRDLGWKSLAVNLSDIAAMGGKPLYSLVTLGVTPRTSVESLVETYRGMADISRELGGRVVGGDVVRSPVMFITVAMIGTATLVDEATLIGPSSKVGDAKPAGARPIVLKRSAARAGDQIAVTGTLGSSAGGLRVASRHKSGGTSELESMARQVLLRAHYAPVPRLAEGQALVRAGVRAAMDVSDGLVADLGKLCAASGVEATVNVGLVPVAEALREEFPDDYLQLALGGGEDYELLFTAPPDVMRRALDTVGPARATVIGKVAAGEAGHVRVVDADGREVAVAHGGWDHLTLNG